MVTCCVVTDDVRTADVHPAERRQLRQPRRQELTGLRRRRRPRVFDRQRPRRRQPRHSWHFDQTTTTQLALRPTNHDTAGTSTNQPRHSWHFDQPTRPPSVALLDFIHTTTQLALRPNNHHTAGTSTNQCALCRLAGLYPLHDTAGTSTKQPPHSWHFDQPTRPPSVALLDFLGV